MFFPFSSECFPPYLRRVNRHHCSHHVCSRLARRLLRPGHRSQPSRTHRLWLFSNAIDVKTRIQISANSRIIPTQVNTIGEIVNLLSISANVMFFHVSSLLIILIRKPISRRRSHPTRPTDRSIRPASLSYPRVLSFRGQGCEDTGPKFSGLFRNLFVLSCVLSIGDTNPSLAQTFFFYFFPTPLRSS